MRKGALTIDARPHAGQRKRRLRESISLMVRTSLFIGNKRRRSAGRPLSQYYLDARSENDTAVAHLNGSQCLARQFPLQVDVSLLARYKIAEHALNAPMTARKLDHSFRERRAPEVSIEALAHF